ncbi:MAG: esterase, partial [Aquabacterium sp.]
SLQPAARRLPDLADPSWPMPIEWLPAAGAPQQLVVLLHGWASDAQGLRPLAEALRAQWPQAAILVPQSPLAADGGRRGFQWYSIQDLVDDEVWAGRVDGAVAHLQPWLRAQQQRLGIDPQATALGGFSQGGILSLALAHLDDGICGRVLSFGGCFVRPPRAAPRHSTLHFFHGSADKVIPAQRSRQAIEWLSALQGDATLDIAEGVGHVLHPSLIDCALHRLTTHIPLRTWRRALGAAS